MTTSMLLWLAKGTVVLLLAMAMTVGLRRAPAGARYLVWLASLGALLLVPAFSTWVSIPLPILPPTSSVAPVDAPGAQPEPPHKFTEPSAATAASERAPEPASPVVVSQPSVPPALSASATIVMAWLGVAVILFAWLVIGAIKVRRIVRGGRELSDDAWLMPMYDVADRLDLATAPRLVMSGAVEMPFACGLIRPTIVLPASAERWSEERRRVVLFHELAHVRRRDLLGHTIGRVTCALYWFHPLVWSAAKRLRAESERACDDLVLACGGARASDYAPHLLDIVTGVRSGGAPATALPMADKKEFEGRMLAILDPTARRATPSRLQQVVVTLAFGAMALSTAAVAPAPQRPARSSVAPTLSASNESGDSALAPVTLSAKASPQKSVTPPRQRAVAQLPQTHVFEQREQAVQTAVRAQLFNQLDLAGRQQGVGPDTALLGRILRTDKDAGVRKAAAWALQGRREGVPLLLERLRVDADDDVR